MKKTKIVCTLGPAVRGVDKLVALIEAGMDVARLNFSHGDHASKRRTYDDVRSAAQRCGKPVAVLADLCGPKIRLGKMEGGAVELVAGSTVMLVAGVDEEGTTGRLPHTYEPLADDVEPGTAVLLDDGRLELRVEAVQGREVRCTVITGGTVRDHKGMNLPGCALSTPALTDKDRDDLAFAVELGADYLALSFVRSADDLRQAKELADGVPVIAKLEKPQAIENLDEIVEAADGVMVARGDLGVEIGHEKVPLVQKRIIRLMAEYAKPVITATQMLDSMIDNPTPTRAEVSDVANAVIDGTDAVMLSGETAAGKYPVRAVKVMASIIDEIEASGQLEPRQGEPKYVERTFSRIIADAAATAANDHDLAAIAIYTESGRSAALVSTYRPAVDMVAFSRHPKTRNRLALFWGIHPIHGGLVGDIREGVNQAQRVLLDKGLAQPGDRIVVTYGRSREGGMGQTDLLKLWTVEG